MPRTIAAIALSALCLVAADAAHQDQLQPVPRFRSGTDVVILDVSVLDRQRMPVRGLTPADFTILEDGRPQQISSFTAVDLPDTERDLESEPSWIRDVAPDVRRNDTYATDRGVLVIVMDDATPMAKEDIGYAKQWARAVVERLGAGASAAVVYALNKSSGQEFTEDRARLRAAIDRFNGSAEGTGKNGETVPFDRFDMTAGTLYRLTTGTLRHVAERLAELPQRRKAIVFVSVGIPLDLGLTAPELISGLESSTIAAGEVVQGLVRDLRDVFLAAQRANVNIYSLDPGGLRAPNVVRSPLVGRSRLEPNPGLLNREFLGMVADSTGGFAVTNTNDPAPGITQVIRENASYYLLGYTPSNPRAQGRYRRLDVRVNRPRVTVRVRSGYVEPDARRPETAPVTPETSTRLERVLAGPLPLPGLSLRVSTAPFMAPGGRTAAVAVVLGVRQPRAAVSAAAEDTLDVLSHAYDTNGRSLASERLSAKIALRPGASGEVGYEVLSHLELKPGRYHLRLAAASAVQGSHGSVYCDLDVPDFGKLPLSLSGVVLGMTPGLPSGAKDRLASLLPVVPTAEREFAADQRVAAFVRVYQGGSAEPAPVALVARVRNTGGAVVFEHRETLGPAQFSARSADVHVELPLSTFKPGQHLLTIEATKGKRRARRDVRLTVR